MQHAIDAVAAVILIFCGFVMEIIGVVDGFLAFYMSRFGLSPNTQLIMIIVASVVMIVAAIRWFHGVLIVLLIILLLLLIAHRVLPGMQVSTPGWLNVQPVNPE
jgi:hypothetical protein